MSADGTWCAVQQGMNEISGRHAATTGNRRASMDSSIPRIPGSRGATWASSSIWPMRVRHAAVSRVSISRATNPERTVGVLRQLARVGQASRCRFFRSSMPRRRRRSSSRTSTCRIATRSSPPMSRSSACTRRSRPRPSEGPRDFAELLLQPGVGARTVAALAFVAEILHGAPSRFSDPARFALRARRQGWSSFPGAPRGVRRDLGRAQARGRAGASLGSEETLAAFRRLDEQARLHRSSY